MPSSATIPLYSAPIASTSSTRAAMCLCTFHHYPCGHIASFTFESCIDTTNFLRANINPLSHQNIKKLDLINARHPHRCFKCERNLRDTPSSNSNESVKAADSKYIPLEGDTADFPIVSNEVVIASMNQSSYFSDWDADISGSDARPAPFTSRVSKLCRLGRRRKHRRNNDIHRHSTVAPHRVPCLSRRIKTMSKDIAATAEEDPGYEAEDDERGRNILKRRKYPPRCIYELLGSVPEPDESEYDTAPESSSPPSEGDSSNLSHERLLTAMEAGTMNPGYGPFCHIAVQAPTPHRPGTRPKFLTHTRGYYVTAVLVSSNPWGSVTI
ncbi:hypothetical protein ABOM_002675 [Aspergillus bombycis]|uniref:Uncharacterized protein n=1 Tax=Aspergillus bombycis TaxID=109264 RepID=A0A1F8A9J9_9EURO|nr:hypothetical protein ABOM_002675 [Aspergillus bombycis]OGM48025.1 hypothetical protein ABOM_002675 [Aspergillus bombycis]